MSVFYNSVEDHGHGRQHGDERAEWLTLLLLCAQSFLENSQVKKSNSEKLVMVNLVMRDSVKVLSLFLQCFHPSQITTHPKEIQVSTSNKL